MRFMSTSRWLASTILMTCWAVACVAVPKVVVPDPQTVTPDNAALGKLQGGIHVQVDGLVHSQGNALGLIGTARNDTGQPLSTCILRFQLLDREDALVASAMASTLGGLEPGQTWKFQAPIVTSYGAAFNKIALNGAVIVPKNMPTFR